MPNTILPVPHYPQDSVGECLAVCALMVLRYKNNLLSLKKLRKLLGVEWFGTGFANIRKLEEVGCSVEIGYGSLTELYAHIEQRNPVIVGVDTSELAYSPVDTKHAVVVMGLRDDTIYVHDPMITNTVPVASHVDEFALAWMAHFEMYAVITR